MNVFRKLAAYFEKTNIRYKNLALSTELIMSGDYEVREHIPHTWASSHDNLFQSNFSSKSSCEAILGKTPDWSIVMT